MARQKRTITGLIPGHATHTRTAETYMGALLDAVSLDDWREVVQSTVNSRHTLTTSPPPGVKVLLGVFTMRTLRGARKR